MFDRNTMHWISTDFCICISVKRIKNKEGREFQKKKQRVKEDNEAESDLKSSKNPS